MRTHKIILSEAPLSHGQPYVRGHFLVTANTLPDYDRCSYVVSIIIRYGVFFLITGFLGFNYGSIHFGGVIVIIEGTFLGEQYISCSKIIT